MASCFRCRYEFGTLIQPTKSHLRERVQPEYQTFEIDLLIIKKESDIPIKNEIGHLFKGHNIIEYKSPDDQLDIDTFYKSSAYACLYKSYGQTLNKRKADDITVSIVRDSKPRELLKFLDTHGFSLSMPYKGIYYVNENVLFSTQIIVTVLKVMINANRHILEDWKGDASMFDYLMEIVEPQIRIREENERKKGVRQGIQQGIRMTIDSLRDFGHIDSDIKSVIMRRYQLSSDEANEYFTQSS